MQPNFDLTHVVDAHLTLQIGTLCAIIAVGWKVIKAANAVQKTANRVLDILKDYPPHRHVNGKIIFPKGFEPTEEESIQGGTV